MFCFLYQSLDSVSEKHDPSNKGSNLRLELCPLSYSIQYLSDLWKLKELRVMD